MKISGDPHNVTAATEATAAVRLDAHKAAAAAEQTHVKGEADATTVKLSAQANDLRTANQPEFDAAKVEQMREAIAEGRFEVNAGAIADRLLSDVHELLDKR